MAVEETPSGLKRFVYIIRVRAIIEILARCTNEHNLVFIRSATRGLLASEQVRNRMVRRELYKLQSFLLNLDIDEFKAGLAARRQTLTQTRSRQEREW